MSVQMCATVRPLGEERDATSVSCRFDLPTQTKNGNESKISVDLPKVWEFCQER